MLATSNTLGDARSMNKKEVEQIISEQMRKASLALTPDKRKANGKKSWETRRANLALKQLDGWEDQARASIEQGQSMNDFLLHCHPENRRRARHAYKSVSVYYEA